MSVALLLRNKWSKRQVQLSEPSSTSCSWSLLGSLENLILNEVVEELLYVHRNRRFIRDGSPGRPPRLSHSSWPLFLNLLLSWCLMSSDVIWHIRDKLWPMPKHGSIRKVYACLAVTCHLHFWQNDRDFLRATVVTRGWNGYRNKSQHRKSTLEKKILPPFQQGFEPATFQSRVRCSNHWAIPAPPVSEWVTVSFYSALFNVHRKGVVTELTGCYMADATWNYCRFVSRQVLCTPYIHAPVYNFTSFEAT